MNNISIYSRYKVKHTYTYTYSDFDYDDFCEKTETEEFEMDGHEFLQKIVITAIQDREIKECDVEICRLRERRECFDDRKTMLRDLLEKAKAEKEGQK